MAQGYITDMFEKRSSHTAKLGVLSYWIFRTLKKQSLVNVHFITILPGG